MTPDEWYQTGTDPWKVAEIAEELNKAETILNLIPEADMGIDLGCGEGIFTKLYKKKIKNLWACDISPTAITRAKEENMGINFFVHDITMPLDTNDKFDVVLINEVLYYIHPNHWRTVSENIYRMLKPKGVLVITCGQFFTLRDINDMFPGIYFENYYKKGKWFSMVGGLR